MMKKLAILIPAAVSLMSLVAVPALAGSELPPPIVRGEVAQPGVVQPGGGPGGLVFTGADVSVWMLLVAGLLMIGIALLFVARRRRTNVSH